MNVLVVMDSFKGSLTSIEAGNFVKQGITDVIEEAEVTVKPIADGGEGTTDCILDLNNAERVDLKVTGPQQDPISVYYAILKNQNLAIIEMSQAAGLMQCKKTLNVMQATTYGVGEMIFDALERGCREFLIGLGGSATNDGGVGMLQALGVRFFNEDNHEIPLGAIGLRDLAKIDISLLDPRLKNCSFRVACDVDNPLYGTQGASQIFGKQKGATEDQIQRLDAWLQNYDACTKIALTKSDGLYPGVGAAGGLGYAFRNYLDASLEPGIELMIKALKIEDAMKDADIVVTGEGRIDAQTVRGKTPVGVAKFAKKHNCTTLAFSGSVGLGAEEINSKGIDAFFSIIREPLCIEQLMKKEIAANNLRKTVAQAFRLLQKTNRR